MKQKTIILTGASGGIGSELAKLLCKAGAILVMVERGEEQVAQLKSEFGEGHTVIQADISSDDDRKTIVDTCEKLEQGVDVLINVAGIGQFDLFEEMSQEKVAQIININLTSTILLTQSLLPLSQKQNKAQIINIGSTFGSVGYPGYTIYCTSKFGIKGFSEALRRELSDTQVSVQYFAPRAAKTSINNSCVDAMNNELGSKMDGADVVAEQLVQFMHTTNRQYFVGWPEKLFIRLNGLFPGLVESSIVKQLPRIKHYLAEAKLIH